MAEYKLTQTGAQVQAILDGIEAPQLTFTAKSTAVNGTLAASDLAVLQKNITHSSIVFDKEIFYCMDNEHTTGTLVYGHIGYESGTAFFKTITITLSTLSWVLTTLKLTVEKA